jgi:hypothetical protein
MIAWKSKRRQEDGDSKMDLKEAGWVIVDQSYLATERDMGRLLSTRKRREIFG